MTSDHKELHYKR